MIVAHPDDEDGALLTYLSRGLGVRVTLLHAHARRRRPERHVRRDLRRARPHPHQRTAQGRRVLRRKAALGHRGRLRLLENAGGILRAVGPRSRALRRGARRAPGAPADHRVHLRRRRHRRPRPAPGLRRNRAGSLQGRRRSQGLSRAIERRPASPGSRWPSTRARRSRPSPAQGIFDYATGKWAPARFHNYVTGEWIDGAPSSRRNDSGRHMGPGARPHLCADCARRLGRAEVAEWRRQSHAQRPGHIELSPLGVAPSAAAAERKQRQTRASFDNRKVNIDTSLDRLGRTREGRAARVARRGPAAESTTSLNEFESDCKNESGVDGAHKLAPIYRQTLDLYARVKTSDLDAEAKAGLEFELGAKIEQFQTALKDLLGLDLVAFTTSGGGDAGPRSGAARRRRNCAQRLARRGVQRPRASRARPMQARSSAASGSRATTAHPGRSKTPADADRSSTHRRRQRPTSFTCRFPTTPRRPRPSSRAPPPSSPTTTSPTRPGASAPSRPSRSPPGRSSPSTACPFASARWCRRWQRVTGLGGVYEPLVVTPAIGVRVEPEARILPLDGSPLPVKVTVHAEHAAEGTVDSQAARRLARRSRRSANFNLNSAGDTEPLVFSVTTGRRRSRACLQRSRRSRSPAIKATRVGWQSIGYPGLRPYNQYKPAELKTRKVDVKVAPGLRVGYVMGTGDMVPEAIEALGIHAASAHRRRAGFRQISPHGTFWSSAFAPTPRGPSLPPSQPRSRSLSRNGGTLDRAVPERYIPRPAAALDGPHARARRR